MANINTSQLRAAAARLKSQGRQLQAAASRAQSELASLQRDAERAERELRAASSLTRQQRPSPVRHALPSSWTPAEAGMLYDAREAVQRDDTDRSDDVFLSHASADNDVAGALFRTLDQRGVSVWVDLARIQLGFSLARQIDKGIARCRLGLVLVTPTFLTGRYWTEKEVGALMTSQKRVIPIIHGVSRDELSSYSPMLADLVGLSTETHSVEEIADQVAAIFAEDE